MNRKYLIIYGLFILGSTVNQAYGSSQKELNALDYLTGDCRTNDSLALNQLIQTASKSSEKGQRTKINFPHPAGGCYSLEHTITLSSNIELNSDKNAELRMNGKPATVFSAPNGLSKVKISGFVINQRKDIHPNPANIIQLSSAKEIEIENIRVINATGAFSLTDSSEIIIKNSSVTDSLTHGVQFTKTENSQVINNTFENNNGFGIILGDYSNNNLIKGNKTTRNGLELIGVVKTAYENKIIGNHAEGTGDNCISISGYNNLVTENITKNCDGVGIFVYGKNNTIISNIIKNNNKGFSRNQKWVCGIQIRGVFGGVGSGNTIISNSIDDDQLKPSQRCGIGVKPPIYNKWTTGQKIKQNTYIQYEKNIYIAENSGITGTTPPTHSSGKASDGQITWLFSQSFSSSELDSEDNTIVANKIGENTGPKYIIESKGKNNQIEEGETSIQWTEKVERKNIVHNNSQHEKQANLLLLKEIGNLVNKGENCKINDELTIEGGLPIKTEQTGGEPIKIKVSAVNKKGGILEYKILNKETSYYRIPFTNGAKANGGNCSTPPIVGKTSWSLIQQ